MQVATSPEPANRLTTAVPEEIIFGSSEAMQRIHRKITKLAGTIVPVVLEGESGTGKEVIARYIHCNSQFRTGLFVKVSCAAIPNTLTESELFGYQKGAFTGAVDSKPGRVEQAHEGTLYLDEITELVPAQQAKLLQVLQDGRFSRIGDQEDTIINTRVIGATNRKLEQAIASGGFRQDLYYRLNVFHLSIPPLRERKSDIPILADFLISACAQRFDRPRPALRRDILEWMRTHNWPGNIRELENWITRYVLLGSADVSAMRDSRATLGGSRGENGTHPIIPLKHITKKAVSEAERAVILKTLEQHHWNRRRTAETLKLSYRALIYKIRQSGLPSKRTVKSPAIQAGLRDASTSVAPETAAD